MKTTAITYRRIISRYAAIMRRITLAQWAHATDWYSNASIVAQEIAGHLRPTDGAFEKACGLLAAFSPRSHWVTNVRLALAYAKGEPVPTMRSHIVAAGRVMRDGLAGLKGPKVSAFARAIAGDVSAVVIDTWMLQAVGIPSTQSITPKQYRLFAQAVTTLADRNGLEPRTLQAAIWINVRGRHN